MAKTSETDAVMEIYEPFLSDGSVSLNSDFAQSTPIKILRDTGASQSFILADTLPFSEKTSSGTSVLIQGVECGFINVPLHNIYLSSDLVTGLVAVGIRPSLPFKGVHLLLGNDLAGDKVVVDPLLTNTPCVDQLPDPIEQEIPDLYPSCAVTRAMAKKANQDNGMQDINLTSETDAVMEIYEPFLSDGSVSLNSDFAQSTPIKILRDTGASQSFILADTLPFSEKTSSGTSVLIQGVECGFINVPLHNIYLSSDLVTGLVAVGIRPSLPFKGVHLLLGNDLAGDKVVVDPLLTNTPCVDQLPDPIEQEIPDLYPSCAVTRAMAKKANQNNGMQDINLAETLIGQSFNDEISNSISPSQSDIQTDFDTSRSNLDLSPSVSNDQGHDQLSRSQLCKEQHSDPEILPLFDKALD